MFVATALSITAMPVLGRIMIEFDLTRTPIGVIAISAAAMNDVVGWLLLAVVTALTTAQFSSGGLALNVAMVLAFGCAVLVGTAAAARSRGAASDAQRAALVRRTDGHRAVLRLRGRHGHLQARDLRDLRRLHGRRDAA